MLAIMPFKIKCGGQRSDITPLRSPEKGGRGFNIMSHVSKLTNKDILT